MRFLITGGAGFIGSALIRHIINSTTFEVLNLDKLTYAGSLYSLASVDKNPRYSFEKADICNKKKVRTIIQDYQPDIIMHLAAESHVDRSIDNPDDFIQTNLIGTYILLEEARKYYINLDKNKRNFFKFHHISTDEVYGDLGSSDDLFTENTPYAPSSPYSASKAGSDHLVRAWNRTYKLPTLITNCSNNYGPYQFSEKLIPSIILNALQGKEITIYGDGTQKRDWLFVEDHAIALLEVALRGAVNHTYNIGGDSVMENIELTKTICQILDVLVPCEISGITKYKELITFVPDRAGHDIKYAIDFSKIRHELNWKPKESFNTGIRKTIEWYLENLEIYRNE